MVRIFHVSIDALIHWCHWVFDFLIPWFLDAVCLFHWFLDAMIPWFFHVWFSQDRSLEADFPKVPPAHPNRKVPPAHQRFAKSPRFWELTYLRIRKDCLISLCFDFRLFDFTVFWCPWEILQYLNGVSVGTYLRIWFHCVLISDCLISVYTTQNGLAVGT